MLQLVNGDGYQSATSREVNVSVSGSFAIDSNIYVWLVALVLAWRTVRFFMTYNKRINI